MIEIKRTEFELFIKITGNIHILLNYVLHVLCMNNKYEKIYMEISQI